MLKVTFDNEEYELIYNEQSGFYEIELVAHPKLVEYIMQK